MAKPLTGLMIFLASPSGLDRERQLLREIIWTFNEKKALKADHVFIPVMREQMTGGAEQAQGRINRIIEDCDYCITMFWTTLGSPPEKDSPSGSKSVTDGEYRTALELKQKGKMKEVVIFFKKIPSYMDNDPGEALKDLKEYKEQRQKDSDYVNFDGDTEFKEKVKEHLDDWFIDFIMGRRLQGPSTDVSDYEKPPESITESS